MKCEFKAVCEENERFAHDAFDSQLGKVIPVAVKSEKGEGVVMGKILNVEIIEEGHAAILTIEGVFDLV